MSTPHGVRGGRTAPLRLTALAWVACAWMTSACAQPAVPYVQGNQGLVAMRAAAGASAPAPAHRGIDSVMAQGAMMQVLRDPKAGIGAAPLGAAPAAVMSETVLPNGARLRALPPSAAVAPTAPTPKLTVADPVAGESMPRPLVLYRKSAPAATNH